MGIHRFPPFVFDSDSLQIRKNGHRLKLQRKPALILAALLERPGTPVSRSELYARLWPAGIFVNFDASLSVALKKLRDCLDDSAHEPRFIDTVSGVGYRFIGRCEPGPHAVPITPHTPQIASLANRGLFFGPAATLTRIWRRSAGRLFGSELD
jgi:DNA-binding winged helix-turn-helix (wHTH) protein